MLAVRGELPFSMHREVQAGPTEEGPSEQRAAGMGGENILKHGRKGKGASVCAQKRARRPCG
jgi:hypothetical protein